MSLDVYDFDRIDRLEEDLPGRWEILEVPEPSAANPAFDRIIIGITLEGDESGVFDLDNPALQASKLLFEDLVDNPHIGNVIGSHFSSRIGADGLPQGDVGIIVKFPVTDKLVEVLPLAQQLVELKLTG